jgi:hypothetical protein
MENAWTMARSIVDGISKSAKCHLILDKTAVVVVAPAPPPLVFLLL